MLIYLIKEAQYLIYYVTNNSIYCNNIDVTILIALCINGTMK